MQLPLPLPLSWNNSEYTSSLSASLWIYKMICYIVTHKRFWNIIFLWTSAKPTNKKSHQRSLSKSVTLQTCVIQQMAHLQLQVKWLFNFIHLGVFSFFCLFDDMYVTFGFLVLQSWKSSMGFLVLHIKLGRTRKRLLYDHLLPNSEGWCIFFFSSIWKFEREMT